MVDNLTQPFHIYGAAVTSLQRTTHSNTSMSDSSLVMKKEYNVDILKNNVKKSTASLALGHC